MRLPHLINETSTFVHSFFFYKVWTIFGKKQAVLLDILIREKPLCCLSKSAVIQLIIQKLCLGLNGVKV